ncbi:hypothetical protein LguiB_002164 [Lonicera macranthoides]
MVSLDDDTSLSPTRGKLLYQEEFENNSSSRKRKLEYSKQAHDQEVNSKKMFPSKHDNDDHDDDMSSIFNTPFPMDRQRCLDIKSGQIFFYNTRAQKTTSKDPRTSPSKPPSHGRLDLELNLPCGSPNYPGKFSGDDSGKNSGGLARSPSWLNFEKGDNKEEELLGSSSQLGSAAHSSSALWGAYGAKVLLTVT